MTKLLFAALNVTERLTLEFALYPLISILILKSLNIMIEETASFNCNLTLRISFYTLNSFQGSLEVLKEVEVE